MILHAAQEPMDCVVLLSSRNVIPHASDQKVHAPGESRDDELSNQQI